ncbi:hypothetical protein HMPREF0908_0514 [Selenomonas flueggei ATCC 43531]|uniref:Uncharacterized protein n=1 Tax=Selenomonas flueggei ATCC 43531 TaxID=638302 RepID=C4V1R1_9FIRM|nr:hypothetical protein HMPREF0908_0514 [Selenomonas flueggei ATCC 43531]
MCGESICISLNMYLFAEGLPSGGKEIKEGRWYEDAALARSSFFYCRFC